MCGDLLLDADRKPQSPREWEQWLAVTRKAIIHNAVVMRADGTPDETTFRPLHAHCQRQYAEQQEPGTSARQRAHRACLSRMHGNVHVRF